MLLHSYSSSYQRSNCDISTLVHQSCRPSSRMPGRHRSKLVVLGGQAVGKTAIVRRFLGHTFQHTHQPTVEEVYSRDFSLSPQFTLGVDLLDTTGSLQFPARRRQAILSGHAFLLVYTLGCPASLATVRALLREISELRGGLQGLPVLLAGNKADLQRGRGDKAARTGKWLEQEHPGARVPMVECSARDNLNIREMFRSLLKVSGLPRLLKALDQPPAPSPALSRRSTWMAITRTSSSPLFRQRSNSNSYQDAEKEAKLALCLEPRSSILKWRRGSKKKQRQEQEACIVS